MLEKETCSSRLRDLIERRGLRMNAFAEMSGVTATTLSKFVNGKLNMSRRYINRAAELLDVTPAYLLCETDDMTPPKYISSHHTSTEMRSYNTQSYQNDMMQALLVSMGVQFLSKAQINKTTYTLSGHEWFPTDGPSNDFENDGLSEFDLISMLYKNPGKCSMSRELKFKDSKLVLTEADYKRLMRRLVTMVELELQGIFDISYDLSLAVADSDVDRALRGEERLKCDDNDTCDIYGRE